MALHTQLFTGYYKGKRVLVTGHTGFQGSWLSLWLLELDAKVAGFSLSEEKAKTQLESLDLNSRLQDFRGDISNFDHIKSVFDEFKPQVVFHLAGQCDLEGSGQNTKELFEINSTGTINVLECIKQSSIVETAVIVTSHLCYEDVGWEWSYREMDRLGGENSPCSSKISAEFAFRTYVDEFKKDNHKTRMAVARSGNIVGGGDWTSGRLVPDCIQSWAKKDVPSIDSPQNIYRWSGIWDVLCGYLWLGTILNQDADATHGEAFNFGAEQSGAKTIYELMEKFIGYYTLGDWTPSENNGNTKAYISRDLNCEKAFNRLNWAAILSFDEVVETTAAWYKRYYADQQSLSDFSLGQLQQFIQIATDRKAVWVKEKEKKYF